MNVAVLVILLLHIINVIYVILATPQLCVNLNQTEALMSVGDVLMVD